MPGQTISRYEIRGSLGAGGMASVYRAYDPQFEREVAIKVLPRELLHREDFLQRFRREARTIAALEHPAIVPVYDFGEADGQPFLVMRLMAGGSLKDRLTRAGRLTVAETARLFNRLATALDYAHRQGVVHRDLKPGNILFDQHGEPHLADFGIVRLADSTTTLTHGNPIGTPAYMSPEQGRGERDIDYRADIYALGAMLFEMLTGRVPYESDTPTGQIIRHITEPVPDLSSLRADLPPDLQTVIARAMAKHPQGRYTSLAEMAADLTTIAAGRALPKAQPTLGRIAPPPGSAPPPAQTSPTPAGEQPRRSLPWGCIGAGAALVLLVGFIVIAGIGLALSGNLFSPSAAVTSTQSAVALATATDAGSPAQLPTATSAPPAPSATPAPPIEPTTAPSDTPTPTQTPPGEPTGKIVFVCQIFNDGERDQLCMINADGTGWQRLTTNDQYDYNYPSLAPDGSSVIYAAREGEIWQIYERNWAGQVWQVTQHETDSWAPEISPDGRQIVYTHIANNWSEIWVSNRDGSNAYQVYGLPLGDGLDPVWSPDGQWILFASTRPDGRRQLVRIHPDGTELTQVTNVDGLRGRSDWSADGITVGTYLGVEWEREIVIMDVAVGEPVWVTSGGNNLAPSFSPDGNWIVFTSYMDRYLDDEGCEIYIMRLDGSDIRRLTDNTYCDWQPRWGP